MLSVIASNKQDSVRLASGEKGYYVYSWSLSSGQVTKGKWFARHTEGGLEYIGSDAMTKEDAFKDFLKRVKPSEIQFWTSTKYQYPELYDMAGVSIEKESWEA